jgi:hypothetical protein
MFMSSGLCLASGTYRWEINGKFLTFAKVKDKCRKREIQLVRRWTRVG